MRGRVGATDRHRGAQHWEGRRLQPDAWGGAGGRDIYMPMEEATGQRDELLEALSGSRGP